MKCLIKILLFIIFIFLILVVLDILYPINYSNLYPKNSYILYDRHKKIVSMRLNDNGFWHFRASKAEIPTMLKKSVINFEDRYFYYHPGINPLSLIRALYLNLKGKRVGGSSISMQVAKLLNPKKRTYFNKFIEILRALQLNYHLSKDEILNIYLNNAPYGGNLIGIKAASYFYFNKEPNELSISELALLSVIPKNPNKNRLDKISNINKLKNRLIKILRDRKIISNSQFIRAREQNFKNQRFLRKNFATHFSDIAYKNKIIYSDLDLDINLKIQNILNEELKKLKNFNLNNASAILLDNKTMKVIAYIGSSDLKSKNGLIDGIRYKKNVGSTLKPFIYALAMDYDLIRPNSLLIDTQIYYKNYTPKNFNNDFLGLVSAKDSLRYSLNITAIRLNNALKNRSIYEMLYSLDLIKNKKEFYGDGIALGTLSLDLLSLTQLYSIFANEGVLYPLNFIYSINSKPVRLISKESAFLIYDILRDTPRIYLDSVWKNKIDRANFMFKTGTSANSKNLYAIGVSKEFSLGVWMGNFNQEKTNNLTGASSSALAVFKIFDYLNRVKKTTNPKMPKKIIKEKICIDPFLGGSCKKSVLDFNIIDHKLKRDCDFYKNEELFYMLKNGLILEDELKNSRCDFTNIAPIFNSLDNKTYFVDDELNLKISCLAIFGKDVYISIDDKPYFKKRNNEEFYFKFKSGIHKLECLDTYSNLTTAKFEVKKI